MTLLRNSLMSNISGRRTAVYTAGERQVDTFDPVIAIPATEPSTALHSWTYTAAMLPTVTTAHSFVRAPAFNIHVRNTEAAAVPLSYRIKVNGVSVITGSFTTSATNSYTTLRLSFQGARNMVVGDEVELFLWCATAGMNLTSTILDTYATRLFFYPRSAGVYNVMLLPEFAGVDYVALEAGFTGMTTNSQLPTWVNLALSAVTGTPPRTAVHLALLANDTYGVFASSYGDLNTNGATNHVSVFIHARAEVFESITYTPLILDIDASLM